MVNRKFVPKLVNRLGGCWVEWLHYNSQKMMERYSRVQNRNVILGRLTTHKYP